MLCLQSNHLKPQIKTITTQLNRKLRWGRNSYCRQIHRRCAHRCESLKQCKGIPQLERHLLVKWLQLSKVVSKQMNEIMTLWKYNYPRLNRWRLSQWQQISFCYCYEATFKIQLGFFYSQKIIWHSCPSTRLSKHPLSCLLLNFLYFRLSSSAYMNLEWSKSIKTDCNNQFWLLFTIFRGNFLKMDFNTSYFALFTFGY